MKNKISLFGFLGFLGVVGLITDNPGICGFIALFTFFGFANIIPDEMFKVNVNNAAKNAFFAGIVVYPASVLVGTFTSLPFSLVLSFGFAIGWAMQIVIFSILLAMYEKNGER